MVLSCCDLLTVFTNHPFTALVAMLWLTEKLSVYPRFLLIPHELLDIFIGFSLVALFVMNFDRYLTTHHPIFHRTSVTKGKLFILFTFLVIFETTVIAMSTNDFVISYQAGLLTFCMIFILPMLLINYKFFKIARKNHRNNGISPGIKKSFSWKNISSCLLAFPCLTLLSIPAFVYVGLRLTSKHEEITLDDGHIASHWFQTISSMNSTFNSLIFYWKDKTLHTEGMKVIKSIKICRRVKPCSLHINQTDNNGTYAERGNGV